MKKTNVTGYHVEITPERPRWTRDEYDIGREKSECEQMIAQFRRHVDGARDAQVFVVTETDVTCTHCGRAWTEDSATYNGGCCDADEAANPDALALANGTAVAKEGGES